MTTDSAEPLPGLELPAPADSDLEAAVRQQLQLLHEKGYVTPMRAGESALAVELAQVITHKRRSGRASTIGNDARVLMELLASFLPETGEVDAQLAAAMAEWSTFAKGQAGG